MTGEHDPRQAANPTFSRRNLAHRAIQIWREKTKTAPSEGDFCLLTHIFIVCRVSEVALLCSRAATRWQRSLVGDRTTMNSSTIIASLCLALGSPRVFLWAGFDASMLPSWASPRESALIR